MKPKKSGIRKKTGTGKKAKARAAIQYTVRNVPPTVDAALRRKAAAEGNSLNEVLRQALVKEAVLSSQGKRTYHDLDHLAGTWVEDPEFDAAIAAQDVIDESLWK